MKRWFQVISGVRNSYKVTNFLHRRFLKDLMVEKNIIKCYYFPSDNLINTTIFFSLPLFIAFHLLEHPQQWV